jgi:hypothetical protein
MVKYFVFLPMVARIAGTEASILLSIMEVHSDFQVR